MFIIQRQFNEINQRLNNLNINEETNTPNEEDDDDEDEELPNVSTFDEPIKNIFINNTNDKVSENSSRNWKK